MRFLPWTFASCLLAAVASAGENLVVDASFESPLPAWFAERSGTSYYAGKEGVADAVEGRMVLALEGWDRQGSTVLSGPVRLADEADRPMSSATAAVRSIGVSEDATFELALFDENGTNKLASFGRVPLDGKGAWQMVAENGVRLETPVATARLGFVLAGPYAGKFTVALRQDGAPCADREFREDDPRFERRYQWVWDSLPVDLQEGEVELELTRPAQGTSWVTRKLDLFVLTNRRDYEPEVGHFRAQGYLRFTNLSAGLDPFCLWIWVRRHELLPRFGGGPLLWNAVEHNSQHHPDLDAMQKRVEQFAEKHEPILDRFVRFKLMDEPGGMSYESIVEPQPCREKFVEWLKAQGLTPPQLGAATWAEVVPVLPKDSEAKRELFYYTGLFRLEAFATLAKACVQAKRSRLPDTMLTYVNYSPPTSGGSWTEWGTDPFLAHRDGGMEMIWTEDWLGYSLGPQHLSDTLALLRAAGRPDRRPLGAYCVGQGTPATEIDQLCCQEHLEVLPGAQVVLVDSAGRPAGTLNQAGLDGHVLVLRFRPIDLAVELATSYREIDVDAQARTGAWLECLQLVGRLPLNDIHAALLHQRNEPELVVAALEAPLPFTILAVEEQLEAIASPEAPWVGIRHQPAHAGQRAEGQLGTAVGREQPTAVEGPLRLGGVVVVEPEALVGAGGQRPHPSPIVGYPPPSGPGSRRPGRSSRRFPTRLR